MDRVFILLGLIVVVNSQDVGSCLDTVTFNRHCCNYVISEENKAIMRECLHSRHEPDTCYFETCYGERKGFLMPNGTIDKIKLKESLIKDFENYTSIYDVVEVKCLKEDLSAYSQEDTCYLREIGNCIHFTLLANCPKWIESDECMKVKDVIQDCTKLFP
ncbi:uncharacterized protein LOC126771370 isoform X2 [Nymphalis io]|uniref:uncharacterized protein LOC126771370 isoform X2 n=1 Tax=Inachis io TaxID=171585 RepID=UPI0021683822|nr:uncharacterized protein LOC126771370 isoform X2 [Nymphalis io]